MSKKALFELLEQQEKMLSGESALPKGERFRKAKSDPKPTVASTSVENLTTELMAEIKRYNTNIVEKDIQPIVENRVKPYVADLFKYFRSGKGSQAQRPNYRIRLIGDSKAFAVGVRRNTAKGATPFRVIQDAVAAGKKELLKNINDDLDLQNRLDEERGQALAVTHAEGYAVATQREAVVLSAIQKFMVTRQGQKEVQKLLQLEELDTKRITHTLFTTGEFFDIVRLRVNIGSGGENKSQGAGATEQGALRDLENDLVKMMDALGGSADNLKGSDTPVQRVRKKVLHTLKKELKSKNIKVRFENTKLDLKPASATRKEKGKKAGAIYFSGDKSTTGRRGRKKQSGTSQGENFMQLAGLINQKLPRTVMKNMKPPGLENITGRFASSVRVTDVTATPKGFPSIGYTYEKNPYQVFEMGQGAAPWATPERDPRNVIDRSIREIAAEMAIGRFFTRRV